MKNSIVIQKSIKVSKKDDLFEDIVKLDLWYKSMILEVLV